LRPLGWEWKLKPGASLVAYEYLFWTEKARSDQVPGPFFSIPGRWRVRARTGINSLLAVSEPVNFDVKERDPDGLAALHKCLPALSRAMYDHGLLATSRLDLLAESLPAFGTSNAADLVVRVQLLARLYSANKPEARRTAWEELQNHRAGLPEVTRELLDLQICEILIARDEDAEAERLLKQITLDSVRRSALIVTLEDRKRRS
jgi:hypothetical protein